MTDEDTVTNASDPTYRVVIKKSHVDLLGRVAAMFLTPLGFTCSKCGGEVSVSKKKAAKLKKRKRVTILCKRCKKAQKARRRG